jgi:hypothetical protein
VQEIKAALMEIVDMEGGVSEHARPVHWLLLCKGVAMGGSGESADEEAEEDGDEQQGGRNSIWAKARREAALLIADLPPMRWQGKMVAAQCVRQVLTLVAAVPEHFDVNKARKVGATVSLRPCLTVL